MRSRTVPQHSIRLGRRTRSVTLEDAFWQGLKEIAHRRQMTLPDLIRLIDAHRRHSNLSSAIRLFVLEFYRSQIPDAATVRVLRGDQRGGQLLLVRFRSMLLNCMPRSAS